MTIIVDEDNDGQIIVATAPSTEISVVTDTGSEIEVVGSFASLVDPELVSSQIVNYFELNPIITGLVIYFHNPQATWTVYHNLNRFPNVTLYDLDGIPFEADVEVTSENAVVTLPYPMTGVVILT